MQKKEHRTCVAYYLLEKTMNIRIINKNIVLLTLKGNENAPNKTVRLLPTSEGVAMNNKEIPCHRPLQVTLPPKVQPFTPTTAMTIFEV